MSREQSGELTRHGPRPRVLVVDDERLIRWSLKERLNREGYDVLEAETGRVALQIFESGVDLVLLDYRLPDVEGFDVLKRMRETDTDVLIIMLTAHSSVEHAVAAMRAGAYHYIGKPFDLDDVIIAVDRALEANRLRREVRLLRARQPPGPSIESIIGQSPAMRQVKALLSRIAASPSSTVLITGESGTGKDLVARAIHADSKRSDGPFLNITCSALPATLLESELFGHERGAFTDAKARKKGLLEQAHQGTAFLDEIGEMEMALQAKLLRVLEGKEFRRIGGSADIHTDVRVIAATNVDLRSAVRSARFREDLYYRLAVLTVHIPPLREREGDVELLAQFFIERFNAEFCKKVKKFTPEAMRLLKHHPWPGNVRELRNAVERAVLLTDSEALDVDDFSGLGSTAVDDEVFRLPAAGIDIRELEKSLVVQALERANGNQTRAGALLGMNRDQIRYRIETFGLSALKRSFDAN
jgi:two-component system, NtrC family, response regulator AtoC